MRDLFGVLRAMLERPPHLNSLPQRERKRDGIPSPRRGEAQGEEPPSTVSSARHVVLLIVITTLVAQSILADEGATAGRQILAKYQDAVVIVKLVVKQGMSFGGRDAKQEQKTSTTGTVIDPSGLVVVSLSAVDPSTTLSTIYGKAMRSQSSGQEFKFESELMDVKIQTADGTETPAEVVLRDKDLDLAYIRPTEKLPKKISSIALAAEAKPAVLDQVIVINRLGNVANRAAAVSVGRIEAMVDKPRPFYVLGGASWAQALGAPVFSLDGKLLGVLLLRTSKSQEDIGISSMFSGASGLGIMPIIVPTADVLDGAKQALEAKKPGTQPSE
jgi:S1-C subfamily serine protease